MQKNGNIMNWKLKAFIQNCIAAFPSKLSDEMYFQMQRHTGTFKKPFNPLGRFSIGVEICKKILRNNNILTGKIFFEVGTGREAFLPVAFWLCGAEKTITVDLNPRMRDELIKDMMIFVKNNETETRKIFGTLLVEERFNLLLDYSRKNKMRRKDFLELCQIEYLAPADAAKTNLPGNSVHYHISYAVYEHIPLNILYDILKEGNKIISKDGLFIDVIDYADHFSIADNRVADKNVPAINFLQYSDAKWNKYAGNQFMYANRARHDDFLELFAKAGRKFLEINTNIDKETERILKNNEIELHDSFKNKSIETLSIIEASFVTKI